MILRRSLHQSYFVVAMCGGIIFGTILALVFRINFFVSPVWIVFFAVGMLFVYFQPKFVFVIIAVIAGMILAFFRSSMELVGENYVRQFYGQTVIVTGVIDGDPETDESGTKFKLKDLKFGENGEYNADGSLYVSEYKNENLARGDNVILNGKLDGGFGTYVGYMYKPKIEKWSRPEPGDLVLKIRNWFATRIENLIPEPQVKLGLSYLLGMKSGLPDDLDEKG